MIERLNDRVRRILVVDDHPVVRRGLRELLAHEPNLEVCGEAADAQEALRMVESLSPDLMIVDISLNGTDGIDLIERVRAQWPEARMLVSSMHDEETFADRALAAGAMGYVCKSEAVSSVLDAIRMVLHGTVYLSPGMTERILRSHPVSRSSSGPGVDRPAGAR